MRNRHQTRETYSTKQLKTVHTKRTRKCIGLTHLPQNGSMHFVYLKSRRLRWSLITPCESQPVKVDQAGKEVQRKCLRGHRFRWRKSLSLTRGGAATGKPQLLAEREHIFKDIPAREMEWHSPAILFSLLTVLHSSPCDYWLL